MTQLIFPILALEGSRSSPGSISSIAEDLTERTSHATTYSRLPTIRDDIAPDYVRTDVVPGPHDGEP